MTDECFATSENSGVEMLSVNWAGPHDTREGNIKWCDVIYKAAIYTEVDQALEPSGGCVCKGAGGGRGGTQDLGM